MAVGVDPSNQLFGVIGAAQLGQVPEHIVKAPGIREELPYGSKGSPVTVISLPVGINEVDRITVIVELSLIHI